MKKQMINLKVFLQLAAVLSFVGFCSAAQAQIVVNLQVNSNQNKLTITTHGACSRQPNPPGCVRASGRVQINFNLVGNAKCSAGGDWELSYVALGNSSGRPGNISAVAAGDFNANQGSGVVTPVSRNKRHISVRDNNSQAYDIWYTVYAKCAASGATINSDPRVENDGTGTN